MRKLTLSLTLALLICFVLSVTSNAKQVEVMTQKVIRVHIIANSDSDADQSEKLAVRDALSALLADIMPRSVTKAQATHIIQDNLCLIEQTADQALESIGSDHRVSASIEKRSFPTRIYDCFTLPAGEYDSLCVTVGSGEGKNFWCVLYPSVCIGSVMELEETGVFTDEELLIIKEPQRVKYKLFCFELLEKLRRLFR